MNEIETTGPQQWRLTFLAGTSLRLPGGVEIGWNVEDNAPLFKRRLPDQPGLVCTVRLLPEEPPGLHQPVLDGCALRRVRERLAVPLRQVAAASGLSYAYLNNVERGEPGRPLTAGVLAAYRRAGVVLPGVAVGVCPVPAAERR